MDKTIDNIKINCVDYHEFFGAKIDRESNRVSGLSNLNSNRKNFSAYMPNNIEWGQKLPMNMVFKIRVESNVKLNLYNNEGVPLIKPEQTLEPEVHFM